MWTFCNRAQSRLLRRVGRFRVYHGISYMSIRGECMCTSLWISAALWLLDLTHLNLMGLEQPYWSCISKKHCNTKGPSSHCIVEDLKDPHLHRKTLGLHFTLGTHTHDIIPSLGIWRISAVEEQPARRCHQQTDRSKQDGPSNLLEHDNNVR